MAEGTTRVTRGQEKLAFSEETEERNGERIALECHQRRTEDNVIPTPRMQEKVGQCLNTPPIGAWEFKVIILPLAPLAIKERKSPNTYFFDTLFSYRYDKPIELLRI